MSPSRKASGPKTQIEVTKEAATPGATCRVPSIAASSGARPARRSRATFSAMTMESSMMMPMAISSATMVSMFSE